jgi:ATP-dependent Clp protease ATP-binding subunit ClpB
LDLALSAQAVEALANEGYDPSFGARPLKRVIQQRLENAIAGKILEGAFQEGDTVNVDFTGKSFTFSSTSTAQPSSNAKTL